MANLGSQKLKKSRILRSKILKSRDLGTKKVESRNLGILFHPTPPPPIQFRKEIKQEGYQI